MTKDELKENLRLIKESYDHKMLTADRYDALELAAHQKYIYSLEDEKERLNKELSRLKTKLGGEYATQRMLKDALEVSEKVKEMLYDIIDDADADLADMHESWRFVRTACNKACEQNAELIKKLEALYKGSET